ncbi:MAG: TIGR04211 family SH3 domain-containing protein [Plesiomonas sp.]|uniref:TIGR04211 family SH3 domain-containing protein n=1 Tax=Plesiomonas sp. TaxID=2486279 RepID=UPI003F357956
MPNKRYLHLAALLLAACSFNTLAAETRYISDTLQTYVHSGPGNQYRIVGTLNAGEPVTLDASNAQSGYAQVTDSKGRQVWLPANQLSTTPSLRTRVPELEAQVKTLSEKLSTIDNSWQERTKEMQHKVSNSDADLSALKNENNRLKSELKNTQDKMLLLSTQLNGEKREILMRWFIYGGGVAGIGLLIGLVLPSIMPTRKRKDRWMK